MRTPVTAWMTSKSREGYDLMGLSIDSACDWKAKIKHASCELKPLA